MCIVESWENVEMLKKKVKGLFAIQSLSANYYYFRLLSFVSVYL